MGRGTRVYVAVRRELKHMTYLLDVVNTFKQMCL